MRDERAPLRILMILESVFPSARGGGAESQVRTLAGGLRRRKQRVTIIAPMLAYGPQQRIVRIDGTPVLRLPYPQVFAFGSLWLWLRLAGLLWTRRTRYDVWHVHIAHYLGAVAAAVGSVARRRVLVKVSGWWELERGVFAPGAGLAARIARRLLLRAEAWQAISRRIADALNAAGVPEQRIRALPNGVDLSRFSARAPEPSRPQTRFVFVGRLVPEKGLDTLLDAFAAIADEMPAACLRIVGDGILAQTLRQQAKLLAIEDRVEFTGHRDDVAEQLADADFGVLPSHIEGLSNTLLECMATGLPMLASRISGNEDIIRNGDNGWLFAPGDRHALTQALAQAMRLGAEERADMSRRARASIADYAGLEVVLDALMDVYRAGPQAPLHGCASAQRGH